MPNIRLTQEQAIIKCKEVHGDRYDYSRMFYTKGMNTIEIGCKEHGWFWQRYSGHVRLPYTLTDEQVREVLKKELILPSFLDKDEFVL